MLLCQGRRVLNFLGSRSFGQHSLQPTTQKCLMGSREGDQQFSWQFVQILTFWQNADSYFSKNSLASELLESMSPEYAFPKYLWNIWSRARSCIIWRMLTGPRFFGLASPSTRPRLS